MTTSSGESLQLDNSSDNRIAEDFLFESGAIGQRSPRRRQILGCMACRWHDLRASGLEPTVYPAQIIRCTGIKSGVIYPLMNQLADSTMLTTTREDIDPHELGRPNRIYYGPAETAIGENFEALLSVPKNCSLPDDLK